MRSAKGGGRRGAALVPPLTKGEEGGFLERQEEWEKGGAEPFRHARHWLSGIHPPSVMPDIGYRASILALFRMDPRYLPAGMTNPQRGCPSPSCFMPYSSLLTSFSLFTFPFLLVTPHSSQKNRRSDRAAFERWHLGTDPSLHSG